MAQALVTPSVTPEVSNRDQFSVVRVVFYIFLHLGVIAAFWETTWGAVAVAFLLYAVCGGMGICVGYHRLLTHRSFKTRKWVEYALTLAGAMSLQGGPIEWVAIHRKHHQHSDQEGDPHSAAEGFWWSHMLWVLHVPSRESWMQIRARYVPDLQKQRFYRVVENIHLLLPIALGFLLYFLGGWPWVVWGVCVRLVATYHITWFVNSASHTWGYKNFKIPDLSTNCWWVALLSYGEGWHNNHHAFPTSARHGMKPWEIDFSYYFIKLLKATRLAWDVHVPSAERMREKLVHNAGRFAQRLAESAEELSRVPVEVDSNA